MEYWGWTDGGSFSSCVEEGQLIYDEYGSYSPVVSSCGQFNHESSASKCNVRTPQIP